MSRNFSNTLSLLRRDRGISQRAAAAELGISQALLSHYENGAREPGLNFVCRVCEYYGVSADYLLCRCDEMEYTHDKIVAVKEYLKQIRGIMDKVDATLENRLGGTE